MAIAATVEKHFVRQGVSYELFDHARALDSTHGAQAAHAPGARLTKGTVQAEVSVGLEGADVLSACYRSHNCEMKTLPRNR